MNESQKMHTYAAEDFLGYFGYPNFHDATVEDVRQHEGKVTVVLRADNGVQYHIDFLEGTAVLLNPRGMRIYAVSRMRSPISGVMNYLFVNGEDEESQYLEVATRQPPRVTPETGFVNTVAPTMRDKTYRCPCCGFRTLYGRGQEEICQVCFWQDDGQDDHDASEVRGGPNRDLSLAQGRINFQSFGASDRRRLVNVLPPLPDERS